MKKLLKYLNPINRLGKRKYSTIFPFFFTLLCCVVLELYAYKIAHNPHAADVYAIVLFLGLIIYFAFHDGIRAGMITTAITIAYYGYIMYTRHYQGTQLNEGIRTTVFLAILYVLIAGTIGWLKQTIDILIEREADEKKRLHTIMQQLPVGVIITNAKGKVIQANKRIESILGIKVPLGIVAGKETFIESESEGKKINPTQSPLAITLATGKPIQGKEYTVKRRDGRTTYLQVTTSLIQNNAGKTIAAASIIDDITPQKEMDKRKDDFVNMASHELKTPITSMKLYIDSLTKRINSFNDERSAKTISNIRDQTNRLQKLVNDLLDVSRMQTGKLSFSREHFRLDNLLKETVDVLQESANKQKLLLTKTSPITVYADRFRIYQVITNLITNAVKYSKETDRINISIYKKDNAAIVCVQDFGIGIAKSEQKKIFERLYQVNDDTEKTFPGFGMGLYIAKEIIKRHRGRIWVESEKGKGSTFYFSLPLVSEKQQHEKQIS